MPNSSSIMNLADGVNSYGIIGGLHTFHLQRSKVRRLRRDVRRNFVCLFGVLTVCYTFRSGGDG